MCAEGRLRLESGVKADVKSFYECIERNKWSVVMDSTTVKRSGAGSKTLG